MLEAFLAKVLEPNIRLERHNAIVALKTMNLRVVDINSQKGYRKTKEQMGQMCHRLFDRLFVTYLSDQSDRAHRPPRIADFGDFEDNVI